MYLIRVTQADDATFTAGNTEQLQTCITLSQPAAASLSAKEAVITHNSLTDALHTYFVLLKKQHCIGEFAHQILHTSDYAKCYELMQQYYEQYPLFRIQLLDWGVKIHSAGACAVQFKLRDECDEYIVQSMAENLQQALDCEVYMTTLTTTVIQGVSRECSHMLAKALRSAFRQDVCINIVDSFGEITKTPSTEAVTAVVYYSTAVIPKEVIRNLLYMITDRVCQHGTTTMVEQDDSNFYEVSMESREYVMQLKDYVSKIKGVTCTVYPEETSKWESLIDQYNRAYPGETQVEWCNNQLVIKE